MKNVTRISLFGLMSIFGSFAAAQDVTVKIVQPYEAQNIPFVESSFVFGSVQPASASLAINGIPVKPYTNGGYFTMIPFQPGSFKIEAIATLELSSATASRNVQVADPQRSFAPDSPVIEPLLPKTRVVMRAGDLIIFSFQGAPGGQATFRLSPKVGPLAMLEQPGSLKGIYRGVYRIGGEDQFENTDVEFLLKRADGKKLKKKGGASITVQRRSLPRFAELTEEAVILTGPSTDLGYQYFLLKGTRLEITGEFGDFARVASNASFLGWVKKSVLQELPAGTVFPKNVIPNIKISTTAVSTRIEIPLSSPPPYRMEEFTDPGRYELTLWGCVADTDRIRYKNLSPVVNEINWRQPEPDVVVLSLHTGQKIPWGYDVRWEGNSLILEIRHRPVILPIKGKPLNGLKIALDPGHSPSNFGTIGPLGNTEASVTYTVSLVVKRELEKRGATVVLTHDSNQDISLRGRADFAWREKAHFFISLHCDATPDGQDPRPSQGYSVHYYTAQSRAFAEQLHDLYGKKTPVPDQGLWRSNLSVCRMTQMPSVLLEMAFLVLPEYEEMLLKPSFEEAVGGAIAAAIGNSLSDNK